MLVSNPQRSNVKGNHLSDSSMSVSGTSRKEPDHDDYQDTFMPSIVLFSLLLRIESPVLQLANFNKHLRPLLGTKTAYKLFYCLQKHIGEETQSCY